MHYLAIAVPIWLALGALAGIARLDRRVDPLFWTAPVAGLACAFSGMFLL